MTSWHQRCAGANPQGLLDNGLSALGDIFTGVRGESFGQQGTYDVRPIL